MIWSRSGCGRDGRRSLLAGIWESQVAAASALRWASSGYLLGASALVWNRERLGLFARRLGWPLVTERGAGQDELATVVVLILGMVPLLTMACYTGIAALEARPPDAAVTTLLCWVGVLFLVLSSVGIGLRWFGGAQADDSRAGSGARSWMRPASLLSFLLGSFPLVAVTGFAVSLSLAGNPVVGPEPGSLLGRAGNAGSYVPPVLLLAMTLLGYAIRERSGGFAFAAALVLNIAATMGYLMAGVAGRSSFDAEALGPPGTAQRGSGSRLRDRLAERAGRLVAPGRAEWAARSALGAGNAHRPGHRFEPADACRRNGGPLVRAGPGCGGPGDGPTAGMDRIRPHGRRGCFPGPTHRPPGRARMAGYGAGQRRGDAGVGSDRERYRQLAGVP